MTMQALLEWLNSSAFTLWSTPLSVAECLGFASGLVCVWLAARNHIWNFPVGILNGAMFLLLFFQTRLFADAGLQVVFILLNVRGWWQWAKHGTAPVLPISTASRSQLRIALIASIVSVALLVVVLTLAKGSVPLLDASIAGLSLVAQWLLNRRVLQNWWWWMAVDVISIPVYVYKELYLTAVLYAVFLCICVAGYRSWRAALHGDLSAREVPA